MAEERKEFFIWTLFQQLVRRDFAIGIEEYAAVRTALRAGFGWSSRDELKKILCALWASSREEVAVVSSLFDQCGLEEWKVETKAEPAPDPTAVHNESVTPDPSIAPDDQTEPVPIEPQRAAETLTVTPAATMPPLRPDEVPRLPYSHVFLSQYPVSYRHVAQTWRRLRRPWREGPRVELDVEATIAQRSKCGVVSPPVLRPRRRNRAHVLLLVDRKGSMAPFHGYVDEVRTAIEQAGRLGRVETYFFHDTPLGGADLQLLAPLGGQFLPSLDPILAEVPPLTRCDLFRDALLLDFCPAESLFRDCSENTAIVILSDAGAARGRMDLARLLDTIGSLKALFEFSSRVVWINPVPQAAWARSTAAQIARHVPMLEMNRDGMHRAVNVLRGQPFHLARPLPRRGGAKQP